MINKLNIIIVYLIANIDNSAAICIFNSYKGPYWFRNYFFDMIMVDMIEL